MTTSVPWTKYQDFYLRLGFLKVLVATLGSERRSVPLETILHRVRRPLFEDAADHHALVATVGKKLPWYGADWSKGNQGNDKKKKTPTVAEALVVEADLQSFLFAITGPTTYKVVDWGRNVGLIGRGNQITERGLTLLALFPPLEIQAFLEGDPTAWNPFGLSMAERIFFLYHLTEIDRVTLVLMDMIGELPIESEIETLAAAEMLAKALNQVLAESEKSVRPPEIPAFRTALELAATIYEELGLTMPNGAGDARHRPPRPINPAARRKALMAASSGTPQRRTHKNADHQTIPRFEQLVDLGFLEKGSGPDDIASRRRWKWRPTAIAKRWSAARAQIVDTNVPFLWNDFARVACHAYGGVDEPEKLEDIATIASYLSKGYRQVRRSVGHTPFDSVALMAMALGVVDGVAIEMIDFHKLMLSIKTQGLLQGEVFFASGNDLDKMFVSLRDDFGERAAMALSNWQDDEKNDNWTWDGGEA